MKPRKKRIFSVAITTVLLLVLLIGCGPNNRSNDTVTSQNGGAAAPGGGPAPMAFVSAKKWPTYKLESATIMAIAALKGNRNRSIILQHMFLGLKDDGRVVMKLSGTASLTHGAGGNGGHGRNRRFSFMLDTAGYKLLEDTVILGNNYLNWRVIADAIFVEKSGEVNEHTTLIADFGYILFTPRNDYDPTQHTNRPMVKDYLWYDLTYHRSNGDFLFLPNGKPLGGGGSGSSNPSPPADPTP